MMLGSDDEVIDIAVSGGTPGADTNDYELFNSYTAFNGMFLSAVGIKRISFEGFHDDGYTLKAHKSENGSTWDLYDSQVVTAPAAGSITGPIDYDVAPYRFWKLILTNDGAAKATWRVGLKGYTRRTPAT